MVLNNELEGLKNRKNDFKDIGVGSGNVHFETVDFVDSDNIHLTTAAGGKRAKDQRRGMMLSVDYGLVGGSFWIFLG